MIAKRLEQRWPPVGSFVEVDGARVHYLRGGSGPTVVLIHGANGNLRDWTFSHMERLTAHFDVIAFDRPGHGYSERIAGGNDPRTQARHLSQALRKLDAGRAIIAGHSYGGAVALAWGVTRPEDVAALCLISAPSHEWEGSAGKLYELLDAPFIGHALAATVPPLVGPRMVRDRLPCIFSPQPMPEGYGEHLGAALALRPRTVRANAGDISRLKACLIEMKAEYPRLEMPIELLHGTVDTIVPIELHSERLAKAAPHARLLRLEGIGHMPHHGENDVTLDALLRLKGG